MRSWLAGLLAAAATGAACADEKADCVAGIAMIQAAIPAAERGARTKLEAALRVAEREQREGEFDECMDAVKDARRVLRN